MSKTITAGQYCDRVFDGTHDTPKQCEHGRPLVTSKNITTGRLDKKTAYNISEEAYEGIQRRSYVSQWDILFSMIGSVGSVYLEASSDIDYCVKNVGVFSCLNENRAKWLYYYLRSSTAQRIIKNQLNGAVQKFLSLSALRAFPVPVFDERKIPALEFLSVIDAKIELNHRINAELEGMAKLLYDYWFVQFEFPLGAAQTKALGNPRLTGKPYKSSGGKMAHAPELKRDIPDGWKVGPIADLCALNASTWGNNNAPDSVTYLDLANVKDGEILQLQELEWSQAPSRARRILKPGDTIIGTVRPGNRSFTMVPESEKTLTGSTGFAVLTPKTKSLREFNYLALTSDVNTGRLTVVASGAAYPAVNPEVVAAHLIAQPDKEILQRFHETIAPSYDLIQTNAKQNQELTTLRDWLLPLLMNGQVTVK